MNHERISTPGSPTGDSTNDSIRSFEGLRSRYQAFLERQKAPVSLNKGARFNQGAVNFVIFCALFAAILTVFGIGLSWYARGSQNVKDAQTGKAAGAEKSAVRLPAQPAGPAGHAELKPQPSLKKELDGR